MGQKFEPLNDRMDSSLGSFYFNALENDIYGLLSPEQLAETCGEGECGRLSRDAQIP